MIIRSIIMLRPNGDDAVLAVAVAAVVGDAAAVAAHVSASSVSNKL